MKSYKDHFGNATSANERVLRSQDAKDRDRKPDDFENLPIDERIKWVKERLAEETLAEKKRLAEEKHAIENTPKFTGIPDRDLYLKNRELMETKKTMDKPERKVKVERVISIISATYGLKDIKVIDITDKVELGKKVNNELVGEDPCPKKKKEVTVKALIDGIECEKIFVEGKKIIF